MDEERSGPPSEEARDQRLDVIAPLLWTMLGCLVIVGFVATMIGLGHPKTSIAVHAPPATILNDSRRDVH
jgi:hypothetical protein